MKDLVIAILLAVFALGMLTLAFFKAADQDRRTLECRNRGGFYIDQACWKGEKLP